MNQQNDTRQLTPLAQSIQRKRKQLEFLKSKDEWALWPGQRHEIKFLECEITEDEKLLPLELGMCEDFWNEGAGSVCSSSHTDPQSADGHFQTKYRQA